MPLFAASTVLSLAAFGFCKSYQGVHKFLCEHQDMDQEKGEVAIATIQQQSAASYAKVLHSVRYNRRHSATIYSIHS